MTERRESQDEMPLGTIHFFTPHDEIPMERGKHNVWFESDRVAIHDLGDAYLDGGRYGDIWEEEKSAIVLEEESYSLHPAGVVERRFSNHFDTNVAFDHVVNNLPFITHLYLPDDTIFYSHVQLSFVDDKVLHGGTSAWYIQGEQNPRDGYVLYAPGDPAVLSQLGFHFEKRLLPPPGGKIYKLRD